MVMEAKTYAQTNVVARSPTLQTVMMIERFIEKNSDITIVVILVFYFLTYNSLSEF